MFQRQRSIHETSRICWQEARDVRSHICVCAVLHPGYLPAEDPHHSAVLCLDAGKAAGLLPVALPTVPHGRSHTSAGTNPNKYTGLASTPVVVMVCFCGMSMSVFTSASDCLCTVVDLCFKLHSGRQGMKVALSRRPSLQAPSLWGWWLCWWPVCPVALLECTLRKSSRRLNTVCGSVTYS